ncbi:MAG: hypothetical protein QOK40_2849 [Miltoncostaeaceae bacterium]|jgi:hypothetical protein|nr:hypothetical protein [Miltoncostaeaceae bacterium]
MQTADLVEGHFYAFRERRGTDVPLRKVKLIAKVGRRGHVKVRHEDGPHPGLEEYVQTRQIVVPWGERKALVQDEERAARIQRAVKRDSAREEAISAVLASSGEPSACAGAWVSMPEDEIQRIVDRAGLADHPVALHPLGFVDRHGYVHLPLDGAERLARAFASAEPANVLLYIDDREEELRRGGNVPGDRYLHDVLRQYQPGWALARQWAGFDRAVEELQKEIVRLRSLVFRAAGELEDAGAEEKARRLRRALDGR